MCAEWHFNGVPSPVPARHLPPVVDCVHFRIVDYTGYVSPRHMLHLCNNRAQTVPFGQHIIMFPGIFNVSDTIEYITGNHDE